ncbi:MAG: hypothetical protein HND55_00760 [Pseudomonadota bacterium]|nr:MAG: hypothetical protein HND55_00760 [Pseudomonadota bacterium]
MNFKEAKELSLANPGSVITRGESGGFIVRLPDGTIAEDQTDEIPKHAITNLYKQLESANQQKSDLEDKLEGEIQTRHQLQAQLESLKTRCDELEGRLAEVPDHVWEEIEHQKAKMQHDRLIELAKAGELSSRQLQQLLDRAAQFEFTDEERSMLSDRLQEARENEKPKITPDSFVIHAKTDGQ